MTRGVDPARRARAVAAVGCVVLSALLTAPAIAVHWARATLADTQRYVATVGPLADVPQVQDAIATIAIDALEQRVDVRGVLDGAFGDVVADRARLQPLVPLMAAAADDAIERGVREVVASEEFTRLWVTMNTRAQQAFVRLLSKDPAGVLSVRADTVVLDVSGVVDVIRQRLVDKGLTVVARVPIPAAQTEVVLFRGPQLVRAQRVYAVAAPLAPWALGGVGLLAVAGIVLARRRWRMLGFVGAAMVANALLIAAALAVGQRAAVEQLSGTPLVPAVPVAFTALVVDLERGWKTLLGLGIVLAVTGWGVAAGVGRRRATPSG